jgi:hypothetical protein
MSKRLAATAVALALCISGFAAQKTLAELKAEVASARPQDQAKLYTAIAGLEMDQAESLFSSGDGQKGLAAVSDTTADSENAAKAAVESRKRLKETEISLRKISERMETLSKSVEFESRAPMKAAVDRIDQARNNLLNAMFKKK